MFAGFGMRVGLAGGGRERIGGAATPDEFMRIYDGAANLIGKAYTKSDVRDAFRRYSTIDIHRYFMPWVAPLVALPASLREAIARLAGLTTVIIARK